MRAAESFRTAETFTRLSDGLSAAVAAHPQLTGLVLFGSSSEVAAARRDEWSDHDFFAIIEPGSGAAVRPDLSWLPEQERIVLTAREGELGFAALYDDGHLAEFALAELSELAGAGVDEATVTVDDADGSLAAFVAAGQQRLAESALPEPANDVRLVLLKLLVGVGRARRGEVLTAGEFVRTWAAQHLVRAIRGRAGWASGVRDGLDPVRRFEREFPVEGARIAAAVALPVEEAALALFQLTRELFEPGWPEFPSSAADVVAERLGWPTS